MSHDKLFLALMGAYSSHADASRIEFINLGLTEAQPKILYILKRADGIIQKDLAELCNIRPSTLTVMLSKMEKQNYIYKDPCYVSGKKRAYSIHLTEEGQEKAEQLENIVESLENKGFMGFTTKEKQNLLDMLGRIEKNMRKA
ncbi:MAG: MarR family transcriptional regulator [Lachnospiraceae bacterium]|nr:MarR family transcriptional regulator [Lachnospiraceae bacterium]